jgi:hypothetical protein
MKKASQNLSFIFIGIFTLLFTSCEKEPETPTHELMQGVWEVTEAYDADGSDIMTNITGICPTFIALDDANGVISSAGPMFMYVVYGKSNFINVSSKLSQVFDYANLTLTNGEFYMVKDEVTDNFTIEMKLKFPTAQTIESVLNVLGLTLPAALDEILIYHKFKNVKVEIDDTNPEQMIWQFDEITTAEYNMKDQYGENISWTGIPVDQFSRCRFVLTKKVSTINQLVTDSYNTEK